jgi:predicted metal-dependent phosphoesterase TrpH
VYADLHIHSTHSDGLFTPSEIVAMCSKLCIRMIAITDHDTVSCIQETKDAARDILDIIPAVEMSSNIGKLDIHILGYYINYEDGELLEYFEDFKRHRCARAKKIVEKLFRDGIELDFDHIKSVHQNSSLGRPHIAEALVEHGYVNSINEAFVKYLGYQAPYYEPKKNIHPKDVIRKIKTWKGIPVIAHPGTINDDTLIQQLIADGIYGIEVWHPDHSSRCQDKFYAIAKKDGLLMTGGSDFHGFQGTYSQIGKYGCGEFEVLRLRECWDCEG